MYPGCHMQLAAWEMLRHHTPHINDRLAKLLVARELIVLMAESAQAHEPNDVAIRAEVRQLGERTQFAALP